MAKIWSRKPKFAVNASRSCAELAIVYHLRNGGWHGVWVNSFGPRELRSEWFPAPAARTLAETGAPAWAVEAFDRLRAANGGSLGGFFDVFAWREPGEVRFYEAKVGPDRIKPTQLRFAELALRFHRSERFMIIEVAGPSLRGAPGHMPRSACEAVERDMRRPTADQLRSNLKGLPGAWLVSNAVNFSHVEGALPGPGRRQAAYGLTALSSGTRRRRVCKLRRPSVGTVAGRSRRAVTGRYRTCCGICLRRSDLSC